MKKAVAVALLVACAVAFSGCANLKARTAPKAPAAKPAKVACKTVEK
ncbi:MAG: hypothetical protein N2Z21_01425 [Candidatus Sumerlaeaceae bacterium]|nr:hypothetical protein [Candidatus Sumerlaeaceae bacterium]